MKTINVTKPSMSDFEEYLEEIKDIWDSRWLTNMGPKHRKLKEELAAYLKVPNVALFANGHLALEYALRAFNLSGEVITTPFTFASTTHAIVRSGLEPVFCDIDPRDYTIDPDKLEDLITDKTSAIVPVHVYGNVCQVDRIAQVAQQYNLKVIYDAAHAFGITVKGVGIGNFGHASMFSFHATKVFNTIEGGAVTFRDASLKPVLKSLKNFGITAPEEVEYVGGNAKMNEFQAAMGLCSLRHLDGWLAGRKAVAKRYQERLQGVAGIRLPVSQDGVTGNYSYYPVLFEDYKENRDQVFEKLKGQGIHVRKYFYPLTNRLKCYRGRFDLAQTPVAEYVADRVLTLPIYPDLQLEEVDLICDVILS